MSGVRASTFQTRLRYTPSLVFETFAWPDPTLEQREVMAKRRGGCWPGLASCTTVACHGFGTTVLPRGWDHLGVLMSIVDLGGGVNDDTVVAVALAV